MPAVSTVDRPTALIGPMAAGKSAIGQQLALRLGAAFVDTDAVIVAAHGTIAEIFTGRGEIAFRELEARAVARAIEHGQGTNTVISLGGGAVLDSGTQQLLALCTVVYLECDAGTVAERIARNSARPLLAGDAMERWKILFATRRPVYERLADLVVDVRDGTVPDIARRLEDALRVLAARKMPGGTHTGGPTAAATTTAATTAAATKEANT